MLLVEAESWSFLELKKNRHVALSIKLLQMSHNELQFCRILVICDDKGLISEQEISILVVW